jgi:hypothetical protein
MRSLQMLHIVGSLLFLALTSLDVVAGDGGMVRHAGSIQSIRPSDGTLIIEELGKDGRPEILEVSTRSARVVHVWRDPSDPWTWRERVTNIYRWPVGTFVVVVGRTIHGGSVEATRVEIPKIPSEASADQE